MVYCRHCQDNLGTIEDPENGNICCMLCGRVNGLACFTSDPEFVKDKNGQSKVSGQLARSTESLFPASHERIVKRARDEMWDIVNHLGFGGGDDTVNQAFCFYEIALDKNFTKGRNTSHVAAVCVYMSCRINKKPYLLIDFSDYLMTNIYVLGAIFLQLRELLTLSEHPLVQLITDPSLYIHRFTDRLLGRSDEGVTRTALQIVASMKRDWMQKGRKPSGLCSAAIYISVLSHGLNYSKSDIVTVVQNCEKTLTKRMNKFEKTESVSLTVEEFLSKADTVDQNSEQSYRPKPCKHKNSDMLLHCAHGLCKICFDEFIKISGGLKGSSAPPAVKHSEKQRRKEKKAKKLREDETEAKKPEIDSDSTRQNQIEFETDLQGFEREDNLSDIDDSEVDRYINNTEEQRMKAIIWEEMNKEYLEEQKLKASAENKTSESKSKKQRKQGSAGEANHSISGTCKANEQMPKKKIFSSKVNYEALESSYTTDIENDSEIWEAKCKEDPVQENIFESNEDAEDDKYNDANFEESGYDPNSDYKVNEYDDYTDFN